MEIFCNVLRSSSQLELCFDVLKPGSWVVLPKVGQLNGRGVDIGVDINCIANVTQCQRCWDAVSASFAVRHVRFLGVTNCGDVNNIDETRDGGKSSSFTLHKYITQNTRNSETVIVARQHVNYLKSGTGISHKPLLLKVQPLW